MSRLILIDDDVDIIALYKRMLEGTTMEVVGEAYDGHEGARLAIEVRPDLIVLDLSMPGNDGLEVLEALHEAQIETRVMVVSGFSAQHMEPVAKELGAAGYIQKGMAPKEVIRRLEALLARPAGHINTPGQQRLEELMARVDELV